jgi:hypothetical protein
MRDSRLLMLLLAAVVVSWGMAAPQQTARRPAPKPAATPATTPARVATPASSADPFVGVWKLNADKSKYESGGAPRSFIRTYEDRGGGTIFMITDAAGTQGPAERAYLVYKRDGKAYPEAAVGAASIRMVTVRAMNPRTEALGFIVDGKASDTTSIITIAADGMTMTQVLNGKNNKGPFTNTLVFDKQP